MLEGSSDGAELLQAGLGGDLSETGHEYVTAILTSVERLGEEIESVLDLAQSGIRSLVEKQKAALESTHG